MFCPLKSSEMVPRDTIYDGNYAASGEADIRRTARRVTPASDATLEVKDETNTGSAAAAGVVTGAPHGRRGERNAARTSATGFASVRSSGNNAVAWECGPSRSGPLGPATTLQGSGVFVCGVQVVLTPSGVRRGESLTRGRRRASTKGLTGGLVWTIPSGRRLGLGRFPRRMCVGIAPAANLGRGTGWEGSEKSALAGAVLWSAEPTSDFAGCMRAQSAISGDGGARTIAYGLAKAYCGIQHAFASMTANGRGVPCGGRAPSESRRFFTVRAFPGRFVPQNETFPP